MIFIAKNLKENEEFIQKSLVGLFKKKKFCWENTVFK